MHANIRSPLDMARATLVNPAPGTPPAALQHVWERAKAARGQPVHFHRLEPLARAIAAADDIPLAPCNRVIADLRRARAGDKPTGGDAA